MPYLCQIRTDIPEGILQVLDLEPNTSQRNQIYDDPGQTKYLRRAQNDTVAVANGATVAAYKGVAAWLIDTISDENAADLEGDGGALTSAEANTIAAALIARMDAGEALTVADVNTVIADTVADSGIGVGASVGTLEELLKILAGAEYVVPAGTPADPAAGEFKGAAAGSFTPGKYRPTVENDALTASLDSGELATFSDATFVYGSTAGAAVVVYDDDGSVLS